MKKSTVFIIGRSQELVMTQVCVGTLVSGVWCGPVWWCGGVWKDVDLETGTPFIFLFNAQCSELCAILAD